MAWLSQTTNFVSQSFANNRSQVPLFIVAGTSFTLGFLWSSVFPRKDHGGALLLSPRTSAAASASPSKLEDGEQPLPLDVLPGARDVPTPYGSVRVYEWGPEDGAKVLLVHGITTPCLALGGLAHALADRGYRVMMFDL